MFCGSLSARQNWQIHQEQPANRWSQISGDTVPNRGMPKKKRSQTAQEISLDDLVLASVVSWRRWRRPPTTTTTTSSPRVKCCWSEKVYHYILQSLSISPPLPARGSRRWNAEICAQAEATPRASARQKTACGTERTKLQSQKRGVAVVGCCTGVVCTSSSTPSGMHQREEKGEKCSKLWSFL